MTRFGSRMALPVRPPFRLDATVDALRRLASNAVDVVDADGTLYRALEDANGTAVVAVRQTGADVVEVRASGTNARRWLPSVARLLGAAVDLRDWDVRASSVDWLRPLARRLCGLKPPRYPTLWEGCAHAIVFQQISIHAAAAIMRRFVEALSAPVDAGGFPVYPFPSPRRLLDAPDEALFSAGLSRPKVRHLRSAASAIADGTLREQELEGMTTPQAAQTLCAVPGIGPWSASVILLRGLGRLDVFPAGDSGVARSLAAVGAAGVDLTDALDRLGPVRGMLYFHLLLGRLGERATGAPPIRSTPG